MPGPSSLPRKALAFVYPDFLAIKCCVQSLISSSLHMTYFCLSMTYICRSPGLQSCLLWRTRQQYLGKAARNPSSAPCSTAGAASTPKKLQRRQMRQPPCRNHKNDLEDISRNTRLLLARISACSVFSLHGEESSLCSPDLDNTLYYCWQLRKVHA